MKKYTWLIHAVACGLVGYRLSTLGVSIADLDFWLIMSAMLVVQVVK